jgi:hypothetical protein
MTIISVACALKIIMIYMVNFTHNKINSFYFSACKLYLSTVKPKKEEKLYKKSSARGKNFNRHWTPIQKNMGRRNRAEVIL